MSYQKITIIIPVRNEEKYIRGCIEGVFRQDYPQEMMEILVVDGMSSDSTRAIVEELASQNPGVNLRILDNPRQIVPTGLNIALRKAMGDIIIRVDGHTVIAPDYVKQCVQTLHKSTAENVGGRMNPVGSNLVGEAIALATSTPFGVGGGRFHFSEKEEYVDTVYMGAWPCEVFGRIGLFDEELVRDQDDEFNYRLREAGGKILLSPQIRSEYSVRSTLSGLWRQYFQYGFWKVRVLQKHPRQMSLRQFVPPAFVLSLVASLLLTLVFSWGWAFLALLSGTYLLADMMVSFYKAASTKWIFLFLLPITFPVLHLSYGSGLIVGLFAFWDRWKDKTGKTPTLQQ